MQSGSVAISPTTTTCLDVAQTGKAPRRLKDLSGNHDDPRGPTTPEREECPQPGHLETAKITSHSRRMGVFHANRQRPLPEPLERDRSEKNDRGDHAAAFNERQLSVKPGPIAVRTVRLGSPWARSFSSTNSAVGDDMFP